MELPGWLEWLCPIHSPLILCCGFGGAALIRLFGARAAALLLQFFPLMLILGIALALTLGLTHC